MADNNVPLPPLTYPTDHCVSIIERERQLQQALNEIAALKTMIADPHEVHINILRGTIPLSRANAIHIAGLPADVDKQLAENTELRATVERLNQEMSEAIDASTKD
jgi:hypothetical protein